MQQVFIKLKKEQKKPHVLKMHPQTKAEWSVAATMATDKWRIEYSENHS